MRCALSMCDSDSPRFVVLLVLMVGWESWVQPKLQSTQHRISIRLVDWWKSVSIWESIKLFIIWTEAKSFRIQIKLVSLPQSLSSLSTSSSSSCLFVVVFSILWRWLLAFSINSIHGVRTIPPLNTHTPCMWRMNNLVVQYCFYFLSLSLLFGLAEREFHILITKGNYYLIISREKKKEEKRRRRWRQRRIETTSIGLLASELSCVHCVISPAHARARQSLWIAAIVRVRPPHSMVEIISEGSALRAA